MTVSGDALKELLELCSGVGRAFLPVASCLDKKESDVLSEP